MVFAFNRMSSLSMGTADFEFVALFLLNRRFVLLLMNSSFLYRVLVSFVQCLTTLVREKN